LALEDFWSLAPGHWSFQSKRRFRAKFFQEPSNISLSANVLLLRREIAIEKRRAMKTVLKDAKTGLLLRNMDEWTSSIEDAAGFRDTLAALKFCQRHNLSGVAIVHIYSDGKGQRLAGFYHRGNRPDSPKVAIAPVDPEKSLG
jgi:hypothetical protein